MVGLLAAVVGLNEAAAAGHQADLTQAAPGTASRQ